MSDLTEFLLARIAEDEATARKSEPGHRYDRTRVLAECEAKRRIVEWSAPVLTNWPNAPDGFRYVSDDGRDVLLILASVYSDHPHYDPSWRV